MSAAPTRERREAAAGLRRALWLYGVIVLLYVALVAWWITFFSRQGDLRAMRMLMFEGGFLGLLLLGSMGLVFFALRKEMELARRQRNFLSAVTHELRSPIASARLYIESLELGRAQGEVAQRYLQHAHQDLDRLSGLVEAILEARRTSTTGPEVVREPVDLAPVVARAVERLAAVHASAGATLVLEPAGAVVALADAAAVERILDNLVSNAVKYGGPQPRVEIGVRREEEAVLAVRDHGAGLGGADPDDLVQPFVRGSDESVRKSSGVGLGLYLVDELARAHGGSLTLSDDLAGGGTLAEVRLPLAPEAPA